MKALYLGIGAFAGVALIALGCYADVRRRNDPLYRNNVKARREARLARQQGERTEMFAKILEGIVPPSDEESMRTYIDTCIGKAEQCISTGLDEGYRIAAHLLCKIATILPNPDHFIQSLEKSLNGTVFKYFLELLHGAVLSDQDHLQKLLDPYDKISMRMDISRPKKKTILLAKSVKKGEDIFTEEPLVSALRPKLYYFKSYCRHCARSLEENSVPDDVFELFQFCSSECYDRAYDSYQTALSKPELLGLLRSPMSPESVELQMAAFQQLATFAENGEGIRRFIFSMVLQFSMRMLQSAPDGSLPGSDLEHLRHFPQPESLSFDPKVLEKQLSLFYQITSQRTLPPDNILQLEFIVALVEIFSRNSIEFCTSSSSQKRYTGSAVYPIATFIHEDDNMANVEFVFEGTNAIIVRATTDISAGEEICIGRRDLE